MTIEKSFFVFGCILIASTALAQIDPGPDGIGVYFDEEATSVDIYSDGTSFVTAYLVLTNPTETGDLLFWACTVRPEDQGSGAVYVFGESRFGINDYTPMPGTQSWTFFVSFDEPMLPTLEPILVLADLTIEIEGYLEPVGLYIEDNSVYSQTGFSGWDDESLIILNPSSGSYDLPVAMINGPAPVANELESWGGVKSLYR